MVRRGCWFAVSSVALCALIGVGTPTAPARADDLAPTTPACQHLAVVGDSLTVGSRAPLLAELARRGLTDVTVDAAVSRVIPARMRAPYSGVKAVRAIRDAGFQPDCFVVSLGTNDVGVARTREKMTARITEILTEIGDLPVLWINVTRPKLADTVEAFNGLLVELSASNPKLLVADWAALASEHGDWFARDRVHLTRTGYAARATWMADEIVVKLLSGAVTPEPDPPCALSSTKRLRRGSTGIDVLCAEQRLGQLGYELPGGPDERYTKSTARAVSDYQRRRGLPVTGTINAATAVALRIAAA